MLYFDPDTWIYALQNSSYSWDEKQKSLYCNTNS